MTVVVTGAGGYVGSAVTLLLASCGQRVIAVDNDERRLQSLTAHMPTTAPVEFYTSTLDRLALSRDLLSQADAIVHLAGVSSDAAAERDPELTQHVNVNLAASLGQAARTAGVERFVLASTAAICQVPVGHSLEHEMIREYTSPLGRPMGVYAQSKLDAEHALISLRNRRFVVIALRKGSLYGYSPTMRWDLIINQVALNGWLGKPLTLHEFGAVWRPIAHVQDAARAYLHLLDLPAATLYGLAANNGAAAGAPIFNLVERNARLSELCLEVDAVLRREVGRGIDLHHGSSTMPQRTGRISGESLRAIGWRPERSLHEGVAELVARLDAREIPFPEEVLV